MGVLGTVGAGAGSYTVSSCTTITQDAFLATDIVATISPCITFGADNVTLHMSSHTIDVRPLGNAGIAIHSNGRSNVKIHGARLGNTNFGAGFVLAEFTAPAPNSNAVLIQGGSNVTVERLHVWNTLPDFPGGAVPFEQRGGSGIVIAGANEAAVRSVFVGAFARGIVVVDSHSSPRASEISRSGVDSAAALNETSFGILLHRSSGWNVSRTTVTGSGKIGLTESGIGLVQAYNNTIATNEPDGNAGPGISAQLSGGNTITHNLARSSASPDLVDIDPVAPNSWTEDNVCEDEAGAVPPSVCNPGEARWGPAPAP